MHSPVRSESDVFRGVVIVGAGALLVGDSRRAHRRGLGGARRRGADRRRPGAALDPGPRLAARAGRGRRSGERRAPHPGRRQRDDRGPGAAVGDQRPLEERGHTELLLVCPALAGSRLQHLASDIDDARREAESRLHRSLAALRDAGFSASGRVGDEDPLAAAKDALASFGADEVIISTHPPARSRWLERGVVEQIRRDVSLPITHVVVEHAPGGRDDGAVAQTA